MGRLPKLGSGVGCEFAADWVVVGVVIPNNDMFCVPT